MNEPSFRSEFDNWRVKTKPDLTEVYIMLRKSLSDEPSQIIGEVTHADSWYSRMLYILSEANSFLDRAKAKFMPSQEGNTTMDRKVQLDAAVSEFREHRDKIEGLCDGMKQRISMGQSILKYHVQFAEPRVMKK